MSRKRRRNKKNKLANPIEKQVDNLKKEIEEISPKKSTSEKKEIILEQKKVETSTSPKWPEKVQQILDTGEYEVIGNVLRKNGADVGFTLSPAFIASLENPKTLASFIKPEPQQEEKQQEEKEPEQIIKQEPEKHNAQYYYTKDIDQIAAVEQWIEKANEPVALNDKIREQIREYLDTVEYFMFALRKQLDEGNDLTSLGAKCLAQYLYLTHNLRDLFQDFIYEDD